MMFSSYSEAVTLKRLTQTGDKSAYGSVAGEILGQFIPVDQDQKTIALKIVGQAFKFTTDGSVDIQPSDLVTYQGEDYGIKGTQRLKQKSLDVLICYLEKRQKHG